MKPVYIVMGFVYASEDYIQGAFTSKRKAYKFLTKTYIEFFEDRVSDYDREEYEVEYKKCMKYLKKGLSDKNIEDFYETGDVFAINDSLSEDYYIYEVELNKEF